MTTVADYSSLIYVAAGVAAYLSIRRVSESVASPKKLIINYCWKGKKSASGVPAAKPMDRRTIAVGYLHEEAVMSGRYDLRAGKLLGKGISYDYKSRGGTKEHGRGWREILLFGASDSSSFLESMHAFDIAGGSLLLLYSCGYVVVNDALLR